MVVRALCSNQRCWFKAPGNGVFQLLKHLATGHYACVIFMHTEEDLQTMPDLSGEAYQTLGSPLNIKKTKVLYQSAPGHECDPPFTNYNKKERPL